MDWLKVTQLTSVRAMIYIGQAYSRTCPPNHCAYLLLVALKSYQCSSVSPEFSQFSTSLSSPPQSKLQSSVVMDSRSTLNT